MRINHSVEASQVKGFVSTDDIIFTERLRNYLTNGGDLIEALILKMKLFSRLVSIIGTNAVDEVKEYCSFLSLIETKMEGK